MLKKPWNETAACIGAPLVEREMELAFAHLLTHFRDFQLAEAGAEWQARLGHRWLDRLPLRFELRDR